MTERLGWSEFWPFYLREHDERRNLRMHAVGTSIALVFLLAAALFGQPWFLVAGLVTGYAFAWIGHAVFQRNRPATFRYPIKSFASDWRLWALTITGQVNATFARHGIDRR